MNAVCVFKPQMLVFMLSYNLLFMKEAKAIIYTPCPHGHSSRSPGCTQSLSKTHWSCCQKTLRTHQQEVDKILLFGRRRCISIRVHDRHSSHQRQCICKRSIFWLLGADCCGPIHDLARAVENYVSDGYENVVDGSNRSVEIHKPSHKTQRRW